MAKGIKCQVKLGSFKWSRAGYVEVMDSDEVQDLVSSAASRVEAAANATFEPDPGEGQGYVARPIRGRIVKGYIVRSNTYHADSSERKHNRLKTALGGL